MKVNCLEQTVNHVILSYLRARMSVWFKALKTQSFQTSKFKELILNVVFSRNQLLQNAKKREATAFIDKHFLRLIFKLIDEKKDNNYYHSFIFLQMYIKKTLVRVGFLILSTVNLMCAGKWWHHDRVLRRIYDLSAWRN